MAKLGGIYISVRAKTEKYKRDLAEAKTLTKKAAIIIQHNIDGLNWRHAIAGAAVFSAAMLKVGLDGFKAVEKINISTASLASTITSFSKKAETDLSGAYKQAYAYSKDLVVEMEVLNAQTVATGANLNAMVETFAQGGVLLDINNKKQVEGFKAIANALALVTQGQNADIQFRQEIRSLVKGEARATDQLAKLLKQKIGGELKANINLWKEQGTLIENVGALLEGFQEGAKDLSNTWLAVGTTLSTMYDRVLRGLFTPTYTKIIEMSKSLTLNILDHTELIINSLKLLGKVAALTLPLVAIQINAVAWSAGLASVAMKTFYMSFLTVNAQAALLTGGLVSLKAAAGLLFAAFAGWEIGKYLHENFEVARLAGLAFVDGVMKGMIHFKFFFKKLGLVIKNVWWEAIEQMRLAWADFLEVVAKGASYVPILKAISEPLQASVDLMREGLGVGVNYRKESKRIALEKKAELKAHEDIIEIMRLEAIEYGKPKKISSVAPELLDLSGKKDDDKLKAFEQMRQARLSAFKEDEMLRSKKWQAEIEFSNALIAKEKELQDEKLLIQKTFDLRFEEMGLDRFDLERLQLERQVEIYRDAKVKEDKINKMYSKRSIEIARAEQMAKLDIYKNIAGGIAGTFQDIAQAGGKYSKEAFVIYKATAMAQAAIAGYQAVLVALASAPPPYNFILAAISGAAAAVQIGLIASSQPPSYDQGGISNAKGIYQTGNIAEAHIPIPSGGKIPVKVEGNQGQTVQVILNNPVFQDLNTQHQVMTQIATVIAAKVAPGAVVENYNNDGAIRKIIRGGI